MTFSVPSLPDPASAEARRLARALGISVTLADVLTRRGRGDDEATRRFLSPRLADLTAPGGMADREAAADRIVFALRHREKIVIFGDYDCDGMTATAILTDCLRTFGGDIAPVLASRFDGGYGLSERGLARALAARPRLLITCDCGSSDGPRVNAAQAAGVDVIVIDHHLVPDEPLAALAFLNPHRPACAFPYKGLASCGLALSVAAAVRAKLGHPLDLRGYLDLVAVGTIADVAPLTGDNRALVRAGLTAFASGGRPGLRALAAYARLEMSVVPTAEDIAFRIAPRLNAPGRLGAPDDALAVLLARDVPSAHAAAAVCEQANIRRKELQERTLTEAVAAVETGGLTDRPALVLAQAGWPLGVVGILAGRLAATYDRPVIVASVEEGIAHGSVRSARGIPIVTALARCRPLLLSLGGHEKAAGVRFAVDRLGELQEAFSVACEALTSTATADPARPTVRLDPADDLNAVLRDFALLEPCGEQNAAPMLCFPGASLVKAKEVRGGHLRLEFDADGRRMVGVGWDLGGRAPSLQGTVHVWGSLRRATWQGRSSIEVLVNDVEVA